MLKEFFTRPGDRVVAWGGLLIAVGHVLIGAVIKVLINSFFKGFYNTLEHAGDSNLTTAELLQEQGSVDSQLQYFCVLAGVSSAIHPFASYIRNIWTMRWRLALVDSYLANFSERSAAVEGSSQRLQEDTQRFAKGVDMFLLVFLDATLTLVLFLPVLFDLGKTVQCSHGALCVFGDGWVGAIASSSAALAMIGALFLGRKLVGLEVNNQRVEAAFRKKLVHVESQSELTNSFGTNISDLKSNYERLYFNFMFLNGFLGVVDQINVLLPYLLFAKMLFSTDPKSRILLGILVQLSNAFDKVFSALSAISSNWPALVEFQSVVRRLSQFEKSLNSSDQKRKSTLTTTMTDPTDPNTMTTTHTTQSYLKRNGQFTELAELAPASDPAADSWNPRTSSTKG